MEKEVKIGVKIGLLLLLALGVLWLLYSITHFFFILFAAALFSVFLGGIAWWITDKTKINYRISLTIVILGITGIIVSVSFLLTPVLKKEFEKLSKTIPESIQHLKQKFEDSEITNSISKKEEEQGKQEGALDGKQTMIFDNVKALFESILYVLIIIVIGIYLAGNPAMYRKGLLKLLPPGPGEKFSEVLFKTYKVLKLWLFARLITMTLVAIITTTGLLILGIPLAIPLGIIAGILDFVPNIGPIIAGIPGILVAFMEGPEKALFVTIFYISIQMLEGYVLTPLIEHKAVSLPPVLILVSQLFFGLVGGTLGVFLASPLLATIKVFVEEYHIKRIRGENSLNN